MNSTIIEGKVNQIIEDKDKGKYMLPKEFASTKKNVIVIEIKGQKSIKDTLKRYFWRTDEFIRILLSNRTDFKLDENVSLKVKPYIYTIKTEFYELDEEED